MQTKNKKWLFSIGFRIVSCLMILSMLLAGVGVNPARAGFLHYIRGNAGVAGATMTYGSSSITADGSGNYTITVIHGWSGTVTPSKTGYTFSPASRTYTNITADQSNQNYVASTLTQYTISGNAGTSGATITYTGGSTTADGSGNYSFLVYAGWSGTVTPSKTGYTFSPASRTYSNVSANQTAQDYTATAATYTISGSVGTAGAGATLTYTGGSTTADGTGAYSFGVSAGWSGTVTPTKTGYTFSPVSRSYTNVLSNQTGQNYTATVVTFTISGNAGVSSAVLSYTDGTPKTVTANSSGAYSLSVSYNWSGTVTPSKTGFAFTPASRTYSNVVANQTNQNYTAGPTAFTFASMGDGHAEAAYFTTTVNQIATLNPALVIFNGDLEDSGVVSSQMDPMVNALKNANLFNRTFLVRGNADNFVSGSAGLWETYFSTAPNIKTLPTYVRNYTALNSNSDYLVYSFEYGNSMFIGLDVPGDIDLMTPEQLTFLDARLTYAESQGLTHAFIFFHGPEYCIESVHCGCVNRTDGVCTPPALITIINNHPVVTATFHGHEHILSWTHMDATRISGLTRGYEQFITSPAGGASYASYLYPDRVDYAYTDMENSLGFATISVSGDSFTFKIYKVGISQPVWTHTFTKANTVPTISDITDKSTDEDTATGAIPFTVGDMETNATFLTVTASSSDSTLIPNENIVFGGSGVNRTLNITPAANLSGTATITVTVMDGSTATASDTFVLTVNPVNDAPVANPQSVSGPWNTPIDITLTGSDVENSPLTYAIDENPLHGDLAGSGADWTYTPDTGYSGTDSFTFKVNDGTADSAPATVNINVTAYIISGNTGVAGTVLSYEDGTTKTVTADGTGAYSLQVPADWSGTVTPSKAGYDFSPISMTYNNVLADQTGQNYTATGVLLIISGNAGVAGAVLSYNDGTPKTVTADEVGDYSFLVPYNWSGIVTPSLAGYGFIPATRTYANIITNQFAQNYTVTTSPIYYVDNTNPACTDVGTVGSFAVPFCTIGRGAYLATAGRIVHVLHGTYPETVTPRFSGIAGSPITYIADPGVTVTGQPQMTVSPYTAYPGFAISTKSYIVIEGFFITNTGTKGIYADSSDHLTIRNNHITNAGITSTTHPYEQGIYLKATTYSLIDNNVTDHNTCIGIRLLNNSDHNVVSNNTSFSNFSLVETDAAGIELTGSSYNTVIHNLTYSNEDSGINVYVNSSTGVQSTYNLIIGNLSYENGDHGIDVNNSPYNTVVGNTVHGNGTVGINFEGEAATGSHHSTVYNNIIVANGFTPPMGSFGGNLRVDSNSVNGTVVDYTLYNRESALVQIIWDNIYYTSLAAFRAAVPTQEAHGLEGDPLFIDPVSPVLRSTGVPYEGLGILGDYYLQPGSPAIDSGYADAPSEPETDLVGNARVDDPGTPDTGAGIRTYDDRGVFEFLPLGQSLPVVSTQAVTGIAMTTATANGTIEATGEPLPTQHGVVWSTSPNPTTDDSKTTDGPVTAVGAFTSSITGLTPGTLYHVRAYATNAVGTVYGEDVTFTAYQLPTVTTQAVTGITTTTATGNGNVTALGVPNPIQHGVVWSTSPAPTIADEKTTDGPVGATGAFTSSITGLTPGTLYYVRAYATNAAGTVYGDEVSFTAYQLPSVTTQIVTSITTTTAVGNGNVTALGVPNPSQHGMVWSTSPAPTTADSKTTEGAVGVTGAFTSDMTGLTPGTLYYVRAYAVNSAGTVYGEEVSFTTLLAPTVTTQAVTDITTTTATGNGNITVLGTYNPTEHGVVWSTLPNPTTADSKTTDGPVSATGEFTSLITGLTPGVTYHVRAYATSDAGTSYGEDVTFTAHIVPTVSTQAVTSIGTTTAVGNGTIEALGVPNPTQHGVVWSASPNPTIADNKTIDGDVTATGAFTSSITGLTPGMLYYVRAYATNAAGTAYGEEVSFTTLPSITGTTTPNTVAGTGTNVPVSGKADWANPGYVTADDTSYSSATLTGSILSSAYLQGTNFGFSIPSNASISGVVVTIGRYESGQRDGYFDVRDSVVRLIKGGSIVGSNKAASGTEWPIGSPVAAIYGSPVDLWGVSWTPEEINAGNFGVALSVISDVNRIAYVDYIQVSVTYTVTMVGSNTTVNCGAGTPVVTYGSSITCVATVTRGSGTKTPSGTVSWSSNGSGNFVTSPCTLSGSDGTATCSVTYDVTTVGTGSHLITANYSGDPDFFPSVGLQTVTVNKKAASVTPDAVSKVYGDSDPALTGVLTGFVPADNVTATYGRVPGETVVDGPYVISAILNPGDVLSNYIITYNTANFTITPKAASVTPDAASKVYGDSDPALTGVLTGFAPADNVTAVYARVPGETVVDGPYTISATLSPSEVLGNYTITYNTANFTITPKDASVTPDAASKVYGDSDPALTGILTGFVPADNVTAAYARVPGETVVDGPYTISAALSPSEVLSNYTITYNTADFTITAKAITITPNDGQGKVYGDVDPVFAYTASPELGSGDSFTGALGREAGADVGAYAFTLGDLSAGANYTLTLDPGHVFNINVKLITIEPASDQTKVYGDSDPLPFTYIYTPLVGTDSISGVLGRETGEDVGTYAFTLGSLDAGANYSLQLASSNTFAITAKAITITPDDGQSKAYGADDPVFTFTPSPSLVGGDAFTGGLERVSGETVGTYAFTLGTLSAGSNYELTLEVGHTFEITKAVATVTLSNLSQTYDETPKSVTVTTDPLGLTVDVTYDGSATPPSAIGSYAVIATVNDPNYSGSANGTLEIVQATSTHSIPLSVGWNLVSFNVHPSDTSIAAVLSSISGNYNLVYAWDATGAHSTSGNWVKYAPPPAPPYANTLTDLDETMGFWIRMTSADTLEVTGLVPVTTNINLYTNAGGWNLVGYPSNTNRPLPLVLSSNGVGTDFTLVYSYRAIDLSDPWKLFNRLSPPYANDLTELIPGWGYWIRVLVDHVWSVKYLP